MSDESFESKRLDRLTIRLKELRHSYTIHLTTLQVVRSEIAVVRTAIAEIADKGQGVLPL